MATGPWHTLLLGMFFGIVWMSTQAVMPFVLGRAIDRGVAAEDIGALLTWAMVMFGIGLCRRPAASCGRGCATTGPAGPPW